MKYIYGIVVCFVLATIAQMVAKYIGGPYMLYALGVGIVVRRVCFMPPYKAGIDFTGKKVLRWGVALLGARITFTEISSLGLDVVLWIIAMVGATLVFGAVMGRVLGVGTRMGVLTGGSTAICGASAAMAIASVFPPSQKLEQQTLFTVVGVNVLSTIAMVLYPLLAVGMGYNMVQSGIFLGASIHDVAQVVGAGFSMSLDTGSIAVITKLLRVGILLPIVFILGAIVYWVSRRGYGQSGDVHVNAPFPWFLIGFLVLVAMNSLGVLAFQVPFQILWGVDMSVAHIVAIVSKWFLTMAVIALGMKTSFMGIVSVGGRAMVLLILEMMFIAVLSLAIASYAVL